MLDLIDWLKENIPEEDSSTGLGTGLVHGDYRVDNLVFHPTEVFMQSPNNFTLFKYFI